MQKKFIFKLELDKSKLLIRNVNNADELAGNVWERRKNTLGIPTARNWKGKLLVILKCQIATFAELIIQKTCYTVEYLTPCL